MARRKELRSARNVNFIAEGDTYDKVQKILNGKTFGQAVRDWMESMVHEYEGMEGLIPLDSQYSMDDFTKIGVEDVKKVVNSMEDRAALNHIRVLGEQMVQISRTKLRLLNKDLQI